MQQDQPSNGDGVLFQEYGMQLRTDAEGELIFNVLCGGVGQFGVEFALDADERNRYVLEGDAFLRQLDAEVRHDPQRYAIRGRFC